MRKNMDEFEIAAIEAIDKLREFNFEYYFERWPKQYKTRWSIIKERILDTYYGYGCLGKPGIQFWPDGLEIIINGEYRKFPVDYVKRKFEDKEIIVQESLF